MTPDCEVLLKQNVCAVVFLVGCLYIENYASSSEFSLNFTGILACMFLCKLPVCVRR